ncbi:phosphotransferase [Rhodobacter capsulatus]|uniref:Aminoglycoside phosphotransferase domain-containing protein n=1 Tax=Rhodobacter capsulatus TaxID=1061 RepID=A0A1G7EF66_RHOCA|nr:phosphotransferase [Rhodobacter capsulatus]WER09437.1 phosphotransferase [Rhodobacter capsulatus]SDE62304.1 hypothetical protein SAMN04244550_00758 [Rhodobacter capsulatus]
MAATEPEISAFLTRFGWAEAARRPLAGDASARRYERLHRSDTTAVLMIAPPGEEMRRFQRIDAWLLAQGYSAPRIFGLDTDTGLMLLEDFGDDQFARLLRQDPRAEAGHYAAITDFLLDLHRLPPPDFVPRLDATGLGALVSLARDWYPLGDAAAAEAITPLVTRLCEDLAPLPPVLSLRDFHAENVIWLPERRGAARLGLLDFQDAVATHPAYDLVSALQDARRDVSPAIIAAELHRYAAGRGLDAADLGQAFAVVGAQRALRILGIFARLCLAGGKPGYVDLIPRVWGQLQRNLAHEALAPLRAVVTQALLPPDAALLERMRRQCGQHPMR